MRISCRDVASGKLDAIEQLAALGSVDSHALARFSPRINGQRPVVSVGEQILHSKSIRRKLCSFCPHCIKEDLERFEGPVSARPWLRLEWLIAEYRYCDIHRVALMELPGGCSDQNVFDPVQDLGRLIPKLDRYIDDSSPASVSKLQDWMTRRLEGTHTEFEWLSNLPLYVTIDFCRTLGLTMMHDQLPSVPSRAHTTRSRKLPQTILVQALEDGFEIASSGEQRIEDELLRVADQRLNSIGKWGLVTTFGPLYRLLDATKKDPNYNIPRALVSNVIQSTAPMSVGRKIFGVAVEQRSVHTIGSISQRSGLAVPTVQRLLKARGFLTGTDLKGKYAAKKVKNLLAELDGALSPIEVSNLKFVPRLAVLHLINASILPTVAGLATSRGLKTLIPRLAVEDEFGKLFRAARSIDRLVGDQIPITKVTKADTPRVAEALFKGTIWKGLLGGRHDYRALVVNSNEIESLMGRDIGRTGLTTKEIVQQIVGLDSGDLPFFVKGGYLERRSEFCPKARKTRNWLTVESVASFKARFVSASELMQTTKLSRHLIVRELGRAAIAREFNAKSCRSNFYLRSDVDRVVASNPNFWGTG
jgi:hypothetical protein